MAGDGPLNSDNITEILDDLDQALAKAGGRAEIYLAGGARMLFGWRKDRHTSDLDGVMRTGGNQLMTSAMRISENHGLEPTWVNPAVTYFVPAKPDPGETTLYAGNALTVRGASIEHMLAMKIRGHRDIDVDDARVLVGKLQLTDTLSVQRIAESAYEGHSAGETNRAMILEGLERLTTAMPELAVNHLRESRKPEPDFRPPSREILAGETIDHGAGTHATKHASQGLKGPGSPEEHKTASRPGNAGTKGAGSYKR